MIKTLGIVHSEPEEVIRDVAPSFNVEVYARSRMARKLADMILEHIPMVVEDDPVTKVRTWRLELGITTVAEAASINQFLEQMNTSFSFKPTPMIKGIVIAGRQREYNHWIKETCNKVDDYPLIWNEETLRGLQGNGLPCYLIGSYKANDLFNSEMEQLILARGFKLTWE